MSESKEQPRLSRRQAVAGAGTVGALVAAAAVLPLVREQATPVPGAAKATPEKGGGYQVTQHVLRYYETTRV